MYMIVWTIFLHAVVAANPIQFETEKSQCDKHDSSSDVEEDSPSDDDDPKLNPSTSSTPPKCATTGQSQAKEYDNWQPLTPCSDDRHLFQVTEIDYKEEASEVHQSYVNRVENLQSLRKLKLNDSQSEGVKEVQSDQELNNAHPTWGTLSADNLSVDARACANPRKAKLAKKSSRHSGNAESKKANLDEKHSEKLKEEPKEGKDNIKDFIRNLVRQNYGQNAEVEFFDAAIVYDKRDYEDVVELKREIQEMMFHEGEKDFKIELYDSEKFEQSKILVVQDVVERCSVILVYLTQNFTSPELMLFVEEAIGCTRLELGNEGSYAGDKRWILKPVHTQPSKSRSYKTPTGLVTVNGIDWFDRFSMHTKSQIISLMRMAIVERKQRSTTVNTGRKYEQMFGMPPRQPKLGPPYNVPISQHPTMSASLPVTNHTNMPYPMISRHSLDAISLPPGIPMPSAQPGYQSHLQHGHTFQYGVGEGMFAKSFPQSAIGMHHSPDAGRIHSSVVNVEELIPRGSFQVNQVSNQYYPQQHVNNSYQQSVINPGMIYQSATLENQGLIDNRNPQTPPLLMTNTSQGNGYLFQPQMNQQFMYTSGMPSATYTISPQNAPLPHNMPPSYSQFRQHGMYQNQPMSRDALNSASSNFLQDQTHNTPDSSQLRVVSKVTGKLITNPNLSTDDVEIDNPSEELRDTFAKVSSPKLLKESVKSPRRQNRFTKRTGSKDSADDIIVNDDSDFEADAKSQKKKTETITIVGCDIVQLGSGNAVYKKSRKKKSRDTESGKSKVKQNGTTEVIDEHVEFQRGYLLENMSQELPSMRKQTSHLTSLQGRKQVPTHETSVSNIFHDNLASNEVKKLPADKSVSFEQSGTCATEQLIANTRQSSKAEEINQLDSSGLQNSQEKRLVTKLNVSLSESNYADGALSSLEENRFSSVSSNNISDNQLFESGDYMSPTKTSIREMEFLAFESARRQRREACMFHANGDKGIISSVSRTADNEDVD